MTNGDPGRGISQNYMSCTLWRVCCFCNITRYSQAYLHVLGARPPRAERERILAQSVLRYHLPSTTTATATGIAGTPLQLRPVPPPPPSPLPRPLPRPLPLPQAPLTGPRPRIGIATITATTSSAATTVKIG